MTMRPSSSSAPNAPDRAKQPVLIDFFAKEKEEAEPQERENTNNQQNPLAELSPRSRAHSTALDARAEVVGPSTDADVSLYTIQRYLRQKGYEPRDFLRYNAVQSRLDSTNLSAKTLLDALKIAEQANHPLWATLNVNADERSDLIHRLTGIVTRVQGFKKGIKTVVQNSNNDPGQLIANILEYQRTLWS